MHKAFPSVLQLENAALKNESVEEEETSSESASGENEHCEKEESPSDCSSDEWSEISSSDDVPDDK